MAIQKVEDDCISVLARGKASHIEYIDEANPRNGVALSFDGGDSWQFGNRKVKHILKWDDEVNYEIENVEEAESWLYIVTWRTKYTCHFSAKSQDLFAREREQQQIQSVVVNRDTSLWDNSIIRFVFFCVLAFILLNIYLFYQNIKRDPYRSYSSAIPFKDKYKQVYRMVRSKF